jgi:hypothetical protein
MNRHLACLSCTDRYIIANSDQYYYEYHQQQKNAETSSGMSKAFITVKRLVERVRQIKKCLAIYRQPSGHEDEAQPRGHVGLCT